MNGVAFVFDKIVERPDQGRCRASGTEVYHNF